VIGRIAAARRQLDPVPSALSWRLRGHPVCASTETLLDAWLAAGARPPLAVLATHQRHGHGQRGRIWLAPPGGVWLSAALPWPQRAAGSAALGLAVAVGLALQLEGVGLPVRLKWPNDLLIGKHKLAGLLPRLRRQGDRITCARVGVGLNGRNRVPTGATSVAVALGRALPASATAGLAARVLRGLEWAAAHAAAPETVRLAAERRLWLPPDPVLHDGEPWQAVGLSRDGGLRLVRGERHTTLHRPF
jgi:BirA family biotin operon repressor/biotin-[acetyl-CoA-carboxylase] ligase